MNICIVTVYNSYNFGSFLQAKNLYLYLKSQGHNVTFYDGKNRSLFRGCIRKIKKNAINSKNILKTIKGLFFELKEYKILKKAWKQLPKTNSKEGFDCVILGSDEIWNISRIECQKEDFWGKGFNCTKIAYAPSINNAQSSQFDNSKYIEYLNNIKHVSVRDDYSKEI